MTRIYTEDVNRDAIQRELDARFDGYTIIPTIGRWQGQNENSIVIELIGADPVKVNDAAQAIKRINAQDAVLVVNDPATQEQFI